jgi:hypothetical protein
MKQLIKVLKQYANYSGRAKRKGCWTIVLFITLVTGLSSCTAINPASLTSSSKNDKNCQQDVESGLIFILEKQQVSNASFYANSANVRTIMGMKAGNMFQIEAGGWVYKMTLNNVKGKTFLTLFEKNSSSLSGWSKKVSNTTKKGITSYELKNCNCN